MPAAPPFVVRKVAVLGAGVMGAQIAAHLVNADVEVILFELPAKEGDPNASVLKAVDNLRKLEPSPLSIKSKADYIKAANYEQDLELLKECDIVIEAISERMDWKADLYKKVASHIADQAIFASNTSGLSINKLSESFPVHLRKRFCGVHFFNPPRYMHLVELIACNSTDPALLDDLEKFLVTTLGKGVIRAKDTPNFIANRIGVFSMLATIHHAQQFGLGFDVVDALTGPSIGRPKSATFRTADVVGLDTFAHVVRTMADTLPADPWHKYYSIPAWLKTLIDQGALGQKTKRGVYRKIGKDIQVLDVASGNYRPSAGAADEQIAELLKNKNPAEKFSQLHASNHPQAQFLWAIFRDTFHYCATHLGDIASSARDLDLAIRWGFGWSQGPFEIWQAAGWRQIAQWIADDMKSGKTMTNAPLPDWVTEAGRNGVHNPQGSYSPATQANVARSALPVYRRQLFPDRLLGEQVQYGDTIFETDAVRLWHTGDDIAILSFKSRMHAIGTDVLDGVLQAIDETVRNYAALVIWQVEPPFSVGANLKQTPAGGGEPGKPSAAGRLFKQFKRAAQSAVLQAAHALNVADQLMAGRLAEVEHLVEQFQFTTQQLKYSMVPTVAAVDGLALGGGCEFIMHCDRAVATLESYIGLVEVGVGLLPAGGGCKEFVLRAAQEAKGGDPFPFLRRYFEAVAMAQVGRSAEHAREIGYLRPTDRIVMNRFELLAIAKAEARMLADAGYRPPLKPHGIPVLGRSAIATIKAYMANMLEGKYISEHDHLIGSKIAEVMCGGEVEGGSRVDEQWLLDLERRHFMELLATQKTQERIEHMLKTGKPLEIDMTKQVQDAYIVAATRMPVGKAPRGMFRNVRPDDMLAYVLKAALAHCPGLDPRVIEDVIVGCAMPEAEQGMNVARIGLLLAGFPNIVSGMTINRFCSSGVQAVALAADRIRLGEADVMIAAGTESMSMVPLGGNKPSFSPAIFEKNENIAIGYGMGITAEKVAQQWSISREQQDMFAAESHRRALRATDGGEFKDEITPYNIIERIPDLGTREIAVKQRMATIDEGPRRDTTPEGLAKLRPAFAAKGSITAGNSSQMSDGAAAVVLMSEAAMRLYNASPLGRFAGYAVAGVPPEIMGIGPVKAIPKVLQQVGLKLGDIDWIELNEAFAAQSLAVIKDLGLDPAKVNPLGGAIALGHPLGATGAVRTATLMHGMRRHKKKYGMITMCIGTGMGAAGIFEAL